jgi:hypothetical protein
MTQMGESEIAKIRSYERKFGLPGSFLSFRISHLLSFQLMCCPWVMLS